MIHTEVTRRHDFVLLFDIADGNPNGDPDAGNLPRVDPETMHGLVTDVCIKRKVRDYVDALRGNEESYKIYVQSGTALNAQNERAYKALGLKSSGTKQNLADISSARAWMCSNFYDVRVFGAVMSTGVNCGQVRGPLQLTFARSSDPITPLEVTITRVAVTKVEDLVKVVETKDGTEAGQGKQSEMGRKAIVPYGLYRLHGFFNPHFAKQTSVSEEDLALFWEALQNMWDFDRSASRGEMACRGLYVFSHESNLGNAPAHKLFDLIQIKKKEGVITPRKFSDYLPIDEAIIRAGLPEKVELTTLVG